MLCLGGHFYEQVTNHSLSRHMDYQIIESETCRNPNSDNAKVMHSSKKICSELGLREDSEHRTPKEVVNLGLNTSFNSYYL